jgi:hypothetical protein
MIRGCVVATLACGAVALAGAGAAMAEGAVRITEAGFSPNVPGTATNAFGSAAIGSTDLGQTRRRA